MVPPDNIRKLCLYLHCGSTYPWGMGIAYPSLFVLPGQYPVYPYSQAPVLFRDFRACAEPENYHSKWFETRINRLNDSYFGAGFMIDCSAVRSFPALTQIKLQ